MQTLNIAATITLLCMAAASTASEFRHPYYYFQTSLATTHFNPKPDHVNDQGLLNVERRSGAGNIVGGAYFLNSFGQPSQYIYLGKLFWVPYTSETIYAKLTGGLLHGYRGEYQDQVPFNKYGVAPVILPSVGFQARTFGGELVVFGTAGAMLTLGFKF